MRCLVGLNLEVNELDKLSSLLKAENDTYEFLGYRLNLLTGELEDLLEVGVYNAVEIFAITTLVKHYLQSSPPATSGEIIKFEQLPGARAYTKTFTNRAVYPIAETFGRRPAALVKAAKRLGAKPCSYGDAAVELKTLEGIPLVYVLWEEEEFAATANVLYYESASCYLPTEDLAILAELASHRLIKADATAKK
jgi:hypothetical protein